MSTPSAPAPLTDQPLRGLALIVGATMLFAYNDTTNKLLITEYNVPMVAAIRYIVHCLLMLATSSTGSPDPANAPATGLALRQGGPVGSRVVSQHAMQIDPRLLPVALHRPL